MSLKGLHFVREHFSLGACRQLSRRIANKEVVGLNPAGFGGFCFSVFLPFETLTLHHVNSSPDNWPDYRPLVPYYYKTTTIPTLR